MSVNSGRYLTRRFPARQISTTIHLHLSEWLLIIREIKGPPRRWRQECHKFAYLSTKNNSFARFAWAISFEHLKAILTLSVTSNDLFCCCVDDMSAWQQISGSERNNSSHFERKMTMVRNDCSCKDRSFSDVCGIWTSDEKPQAKPIVGLAWLIMNNVNYF